MDSSQSGQEDTGTWNLTQTLSGHQGAVYDLTVDTQGALWSAGGDGWLVRWAKEPAGWSTQGEAMVRTEGALYAVDSGATGVVAGGADGGLVQWASEETLILPGHQGGTYMMNGSHSGGADGKLRHWPSQEVVGTVPGRIRSHAALKEGHVVGTHEGILYHLKQGWSQTLHKGSLRAILPWPGKEAWGTVGADGTLCVWRASNDTGWTLLLRIDAHKGAIYRLQASPDGRWVATASRDRSVAVWDADTLTLNQRLAKPQSEGHIRSVNALSFLGPNVLASAGDDGRILIWTREGGKQPNAEG
jgi:WD40 repeat protein